MNVNSFQENNNSFEKHEPKIKIGKDIFIYRTLYLITKEDIFKEKSKKSIKFYLKCDIKEKSLLYLPKPLESGIIIEDIKELIELVLSLCVLTNSANYKIGIFTSSFGNIENNAQLLKYQGEILYAKLNEFKNNDEEKKNPNFLEYNENNITKKFLRKKSKTVKEYPSIKFQQIIPFQKLGYSTLNYKDKDDIINTNDLEYQFNKGIMINNDDNNYIQKNNNYINIINNNPSRSLYTKIPYLPNLINYNNIYNNNNMNGNDDSTNREKLINSHSFNFQNNKNIINRNSLQESNKSNNFYKTKVIINKVEPNLYCLNNNKIGRSNSVINFNSKYFWRKFKNNSFQFKNSQIIPQNLFHNKIGTENNETNYTKINFKYNCTNRDLQSKRNKIMYKTKPFRFSYFSKGNTTVNSINNNTDYQNIRNIFTKKIDSENDSLIEKEKQNKEMLLRQQNVNLIKNFLFRPSIITLTKNNFYDPKQSRFNSIKIIYNEFKNELKNISYNLNEYIPDKDIEMYIHDIDVNFKQYKIDFLYCLKEYCLYSYFDKYKKENFPSILDNFLYDPNVTTTQISQFLNSLIILINKLKTEEKFNLVNYVRTLKNLKNFKLSADFFEIFVLCPNYFELTKREIAKKISMVLEIDCVTNNVTIENFINYYYIFKYGHLVKLEKKLLFINKLIHMIEGKGGPLQEKIFSDIQYLFKIDNRTKLMLLGGTYDIKINFHTTLKINQIFNSIVNYFTDKNNKKEGINCISNHNTSNLSN